ncbi:U4/U6.U5 tri-snRNP-associated protein 1 isoform X2 [Manacus candei]|uniref:U4/U6.U5 tri-snRNP-associated protein 1 isoform X2 n=1 Tax=Manacus candei TaxID=415023 RepID=UPI002227ED7B|nr:U4/U6.U5 tri-snRNP-associated protein 1 isoform X2 [Manacus candei]XP_051631623.1 U4/U6.U5 tri-snRNP-associated protein 1 isoform X2 [Manacus candei]
MGASKKHRERGGAEAAEEAPGAAAAGGGSGAGRPREHRKHRHRGGERRGKRSRSRGERGGSGGGSGSSRRGGGGAEEAARGGHGRGGTEPERRAKRERKEEREEPAPPKPTAAESSLSVEETNKLRAKLGLKPLETTMVKKEAGTKEDPVAADVINPLALKQREEIREKLAAAKEKRLLNQKLGKVKTLGEEEPWLDDAAAWIERSRALQREKELAEKRAKLLEEMDQEFGVSPLVEEEFQRRRRERYSARDLQGLTVEHDPAAIPEGQTLVLTLKDRGVLEEGEDVLEQPTLAAQERAREELELRRKKPPYVPYEEEEPGPAPQGPKAPALLAKYDEPAPRPSFRLGPGGTQDGGDPPKLPLPPGPAPQSLELPLPRLAPEYLTEQEMAVTFRRTRRRVKRLRKKEKPLRADDLLALAPGDTRGDFGSRSRGRGRRVQEEEGEEGAGGGDPENPSSPSRDPPPGGNPPEPPLPSDDTRTENMDISSDEELGVPGSPPALEEDEAEQELQQQLERGRRLRQLRELREGGGEKVLELLRGSGAAAGPDPRGGGSIVFNATSEFCRTLGEIPTYGLAGNREEQEELMALERSGRPSSPPEAPDSEGEENVGWSSVNLAEERQQQDFSAASTTILDEEPIVNRGLAAALLLCQNKGLLETTVQKVARVKAPNKSLPSAVYCIEDKMAIDDKYSRREEFRGFTQDFKEKEGYRPDVKIERSGSSPTASTGRAPGR